MANRRRVIAKMTAWSRAHPDRRREIDRDYARRNAAAISAKRGPDAPHVVRFDKRWPKAHLDLLRDWNAAPRRQRVDLFHVARRLGRSYNQCVYQLRVLRGDRRPKGEEAAA